MADPGKKISDVFIIVSEMQTSNCQGGPIGWFNFVQSKSKQNVWKKYSVSITVHILTADKDII